MSTCHNTNYNCWIPPFSQPRLPRGTLIVNKRTIGGDDTFIINVTSTNGLFLTQSITTTGGSTTTEGFGSVTFFNLDPGVYTVTEVLPVSLFWVANTTSFQVTINPGETRDVTFINSKLARLTINKISLPGNATFPFTLQRPGISLQASVTTFGGTAVTQGTGSFNVGLIPATYTITEQPLPGWIISSPNPQIIQLGTGGTGSVSFSNLRTITLTIQKSSIGGDGAFPFTITLGATGPTITRTITTSNGIGSTTITNIPPGDYTVVELLPPGWEPLSAVIQTLSVPAGGSGIFSFSNQRID